MKKILFSVILIMFGIVTLAQVPEFFNYQAVVRDASNNPITDQSVSFRISILKGSISGSEEYVEKHNTSTNSLGLVNLVIGNGTDKTGTISDIDWGTDSYFLKVEIDPTGGTSYSEMGITQLLSVPYAMYAKTTGETTETDPVFTSWDKDYTDLINTPTIPIQADGSETKINSGAGIEVTGTGTSGDSYIIAETTKHYVGELYGGGVVSWIDHTRQHGLIVSMVDISLSQDWSNIESTYVGTTNNWDGESNTTAIIEQNGHTNSAAKLCSDYTNADYGTGTYSDWYLPSIAELSYVSDNYYIVQESLTYDGNSATTPFNNGDYWSSTEFNQGSAWYINFNYGIGSRNFTNKFWPIYVRAVRSF